MLRWIALAGFVALSGCGGGASRDESANAQATPATPPTTVTSAAVKVVSSKSPDASAHIPTSSTVASRSREATSSAPTAASQSTPSTTRSLATQARPAGQGFVKGRVESECSPADGSGGGCYNQSNGVAGTLVELRTTEGRVLGAATTAADGSFEFRVAPGRYVIRERASGVQQERDVLDGRTTFVTLTVPAT